MPLPPPLLDDDKWSSCSFALPESAEGMLPRGFYANRGKRLLDIVSSTVGLVLLLPVFSFVGLCIKATSRGSVFYRQCRVGKDGRSFQIIKFRSMDSARSEASPGITVSGDKRVTRVGRLLRRYKIDELPQLWNVLRGEMSLVGPRPELPKYVATYLPSQRHVLAVRPGIADSASLTYRNEEEILALGENPEKLYVEQILPDKLARSLVYIQKMSFRSDLRIIAATIARSFMPFASQPSGPEH